MSFTFIALSFGSDGGSMPETGVETLAQTSRPHTVRLVSATSVLEPGEEEGMHNTPAGVSCINGERKREK
jgi:hypothetical protein